jgi:hypothetical protein
VANKRISLKETRLWLKQGLFVVSVVFIAACRKNATAPPAAHITEAEKSPVSTMSGGEAEHVTESGIHAIYGFQFRDSSGTVEIWADGPLLKVSETWNTLEGRGRRWGAAQVVLLYQSDEKKLMVVNVSQKRFTRLDATRMEKARKDLANRRANLAGVGAEGTTPQALLSELAAVPKPIDSAQKTHPEGCQVFKRDLPFGLEEESCYRSLDTADIREGALDALLSFGTFVEGVADQIGELAAVSALAEAVAFDLGLLVSQYKFGVSLDIDQEPSGKSGELESWDRVITLEKLEPFTLSPEEMAFTKDAVEEYGLVPWNTPFFGVHGPSPGKNEE